MKSVLIVDDDSDLLKFYKQVFINASYQVDDSQTIASAVEKIKTVKYDLIILDLLFPTTDTLPTIKNIRNEHSLNKNTPILVLSNLDSKEKTKKALENGANEFLLKANQSGENILRTATKLIS